MKPHTARRGRSFALGAVAALLSLTALSHPVQAAGSGVHGRVLALDENGKVEGVVAGAKIEFKNQGGATVAQTTSGEGGYYRADLPPGSYLYKVQADGFKDEDHGRGIAVQRSQGYAVYNLSLTKGQNDPNKKPPQLPPAQIGTLRGRVLEKTRDGSLVGIPGAVVTLRKEGQGRGVMRVVTRGQEPSGAAGGQRAAAAQPTTVGQYEVVLETGNWRGAASAEGFESFADPKPIVIEPGKDATRDFVLTRSADKAPEGQGIKGTISIRRPTTPATTAAAVRIAPPNVKVFIVPLSNARGPSDPIAPDSAGRYSRDLDVGRYQVFASAEGFVPARSGPRDVFAGKYTIVDLVLVPATGPGKPPTEGLVFTGTVMQQLAGERGRAPLAGASVLIRSTDQALSDAPRGTSDKEGKVRLPLHEEGEYVALAQMPGYQPGGARVSIRPGGENSAVIMLEREATEPERTPPTTTPEPPAQDRVAVSGYVVFRSPQSRTGYFGIPGSTMLWKSVATGGRVREEATAGEVGRFELALPEGNYLVDVQPPSGYLGTSEEVMVRRGMKPKYFVLNRLPDRVPEPPQTQLVDVRGRVLAQSASRITGLMGVPNAQILWSERRTERRQGTISGDGGRFGVSLREGTYDVLVRAPQGFRDLNDVIEVRQGMDSVNLVLARADEPPTTPPSGTGLTVRVFENVLGGSLSRLPIQAGVRPIAGARVIVRRGGEQVASEQTDEQGRATFRLQPGSFDLLVTREGYRPAQDSVRLGTGRETRDILLARESGRDDGKPDDRPADLATLRLRIVTRGTATATRALTVAPRTIPVPGAQIVITRGGQNAASGQSDESGQYTARLKPGTYLVVVNHQGFQTATVNVSIRGGVVSQEIVLVGQTSTPAGVLKIPGLQRRPGLQIQPNQGAAPK